MTLLELPICARCGRYVDRVSRFRNPVTEQIVFVAYCHGEQDHVAIGQQFLEQFVEPPVLKFGVAFSEASAR